MTVASDTEVVVGRVPDARYSLYALRATADDDPALFRVTIVLNEQADGKTVLTLRQLRPTVEQQDATTGFGAVELGLQTVNKIAYHLGVA